MEIYVWHIIFKLASGEAHLPLNGFSYSNLFHRISRKHLVHSFLHLSLQPLSLSVVIRLKSRSWSLKPRGV